MTNKTKEKNNELRYFLRESVLTEGATYLNFKNNRIPISKYLSPMIVAFFEPELTDPLEIDKLLFRKLDVPNYLIDNKDLQEYHNVHWVDDDFIKKVRIELDQVNYGKLIDDVVILLLIYKTLKIFNKRVIVPVEAMGAYVLLKHFEKKFMELREEAPFNPASFKIKINSPKYLRNIETKTMVGLIEYAFQNLFESSEGKKFINKFYAVEEKRWEIQNAQKLQHGTDKLQTTYRDRIKVIRILFFCFKQFCKSKRKRMVAIHNLLYLVGDEDLQLKKEDKIGHVDKATYQYWIPAIENRYRKHVKDLD